MNEIAPHGLKKYAKEIDTTSKSAPIPGTTHASVQDMYSVLPAANISVAVLSSYKECAEGAPPLGSPVVLDTFLGEVRLLPGFLGSLSMLVGLLTRLLTLRGFPNSSNLVFFVCL